MVPTPGSVQSSVSTVQAMGSIPMAAPISKELRFHAPYGARYQSGAAPVTLSITSLVGPSSSRTPARESLVTRGWVQEWFPMVCPSSAMARTRSCLSLAISPQRKNIA
ncbi:hypothetical protein GCM10009647_005530 [Streptomyces sanglieri]